MSLDDKRKTRALELATSIEAARWADPPGTGTKISIDEGDWELMVEGLRAIASSAIQDRKLDKPAQVGGTVFHEGVSERMVIDRAQREWDYFKGLKNPKSSPIGDSLSSSEQPALTFDAFRRANVTRCVKWHPEGIDSWSPSDWLTAVTGELGELASLLKMRNRERDGLAGNKFSPTDRQIADEIADVLTYLDLLAEVLGVDLGLAAARKFNEVSERVGFPDRIEYAPSATKARE